ncbi:Serine incorporator 5 [Tyrophagus putrescentiae]|nr:Serine incorporator 5 [Tyrophagus putrescentiae]
MTTSALGMLYLTNYLTESPQAFGQSTSLLWIKMNSSWICALLHLWTLVAPIFLGQWRTFS